MKMFEKNYAVSRPQFTVRERKKKKLGLESRDEAKKPIINSFPSLLLLSSPARTVDRK